MPIERHPLQPFLPVQAKLLILGSFPPPRARWCMEFYYPNWNNDMWRITGLVFFGDARHFEENGRKAFSKERIVQFLADKGIALYDTATAVQRLQGNASDKYLDVVEPTDIAALLDALPRCEAIVTTGEKATDTLCAYFSIERPQTGGRIPFIYKERPMRLYRMPSSSRAYPLALKRKADAYHTMYRELQMV
ncbi:MAG: uracil-DNA glycosylase family protein [Prevotellaceae bacterium]|nr:uracil-DNA glycosylase family protein [Prevotellaceae bacterium]